MNSVERGDALAKRMDSLGFSVRDLAARVGLDRQTVARAREGQARPTTFGVLEQWLDDFEHETGADMPAPIIGTVTLPNGTIVRFQGDDPTGVTEAVLKILGEASPNVGGGS